MIEVASGRSYFTAQFQKSLEAMRVNDPELKSALTEREEEILLLVASGLTNCAVASRLNLSPVQLRHIDPD